MLRKLGYLFLFTIALCGIVGTWWVFEYWPKYTNRFRFEVTFEANGKLFTGSVVQGLTVSGGPFLPSAGSNIGHRVRGQALPIEIPLYGTVFVTTQMYCPWGPVEYRCGSLERMISVACNIEKIPGEDYKIYVRKFRHLTGECNIPLPLLPVMVRFLDESDQKSARVVELDSSGIIEGTDIRFLNAKITFTSAPITTGLEKRLAWLVDPEKIFPSTVEAEDGSIVPYLPYLSFKR